MFEIQIIFSLVPGIWPWSVVLFYSSKICFWGWNFIEEPWNWICYFILLNVRISLWIWVLYNFRSVRVGILSLVCWGETVVSYLKTDCVNGITRAKRSTWGITLSVICVKVSSSGPYKVKYPIYAPFSFMNISKWNIHLLNLHLTLKHKHVRSLFLKMYCHL